MKKNEGFDTTGYISNTKISIIKGKILRKSKIKAITAEAGWQFVRLALVCGITALEVYLLVQTVSNPSDMFFWDWVTCIFVCTVALASLVGFILATKRIIYQLSKINSGDFRLASAKVLHTFEDMRGAEGPYLVGDSYITYMCKGSKQKYIKITQSGTPKKMFTDNPTAYFVFAYKDGMIEEEPFLLLLGEEYEIEEGIEVLQ